MLKYIKITLLTAVLSLAVLGLVKDRFFDTPQRCLTKTQSSAANGSVEANIFNGNRTLVYRMYFWSVVPVGELRFSTKTQDSDAIFSFEALTKGSFIEGFITANARVESYFSKKDLLPYKYIERTDVKGKIKKKTVLYDRVNLISIQGNKKIKITPDAYDPVGAFVHMLALPLEKGKEYVIPFLSGHDMYTFKAKVLNEEKGTKEVGIDMRRQNLTSSHGGQLHVWLTSDNNRIPLVFKSWTPVGYVSVVLNKVVINDKEK